VKKLTELQSGRCITCSYHCEREAGDHYCGFNCYPCDPDIRDKCTHWRAQPAFEFVRSIVDWAYGHGKAVAS
jgi:hypothetical protein